MKHLTQALRYVYMRLKHRGRVHFPYSAVIGKNAEFEGCNAVGERSEFAGRMGMYSYMSKDCDMFASVGRFTSIGDNVRTVMYRHPVTYPYASTSPMFYSTLKQCGVPNFADRQMFGERMMKDAQHGCAVAIGNDCWINSHVTLISGITVGDGAVVLAGAVVTRDVPPYAIVAGIPAKVIKYRYSEADIKWLMDKQWWNMPAERLQEHWQDFCDIDRLKSALSER